ncbi:MAG: hypothetical protein A2V77_20555 [Anaeromyxobacter sp. RBG_16_69_14]|nr:MAG: hypothetical protein A2V77_20555 [Anaeromyxobacter sp. RBG_16_69_14]
MKVSHLVALLVLAVGTGACGGNSNTSSSNKTNEVPTATFAVACSSLTCTFEDQSTDPDGNITSRAWSFGDGATSTDTNPSHGYTASALSQYTVELTVKDDDGAQAVASKTFQVSPPAQCHRAQDPGGVDCALTLQDPAKIEIELTSRECNATGNTLILVQPVQVTLFTDGCYAPELGTKFTITNSGNPFPAGTPISLQVLSGALHQVIPPSLVVAESGGPPWVLRFDDGDVDPADEDLTITVRAAQ